MAERNGKGQFVKGHKPYRKSPGRPSRSVEERFLAAIIRAVPEKEWEKATKAVLARAKDGDIGAWKALAIYLVGTPIQRIETVVDTTIEISDEYKQALERGYGSD